MNFAIEPWEFRGADFDAAPHAIATLEVGEKTREFGLKMREGVIYFKEDARAPMWAVTQIWPDELKNDEESLVKTWREAVARGDFGRYVARNFGFTGTQAHGVAAMIHRADGAGWIKEYFDADWRQIPAYRGGKTFDVWGTKFQTASQRAIRHAMPKLLARTLPTLETLSSQSRWLAGEPGEVERLFALAVRAWVRPFPDTPFLNLEADFEAHSIKGGGGFVSNHNNWSWSAQLRFAPGFRAFLELIENHNLWVGWQWSRGTLDSPLVNAQTMEVGNREWGEMWRGNFGFEVPVLKLEAVVSSVLSAHETLETQLQLRDWLQDKVAPARLKSLLKSAFVASG